MEAHTGEVLDPEARDEDEEPDDDEPEEGGTLDVPAAEAEMTLDLSGLDSVLPPDETITDAVVVPPRPDSAMKLGNAGPWGGMTIDKVVADPRGRAWLLERVGMLAGAGQEHVLSWLSIADEMVPVVPQRAAATLEEARAAAKSSVALPNEGTDPEGYGVYSQPGQDDARWIGEWRNMRPPWQCRPTLRDNQDGSRRSQTTRGSQPSRLCAISRR